MSIRTLSSREVYRNQWMRVREDKIERNDGSPGIYGVVDKADGAVIIAIADEHLYLVEQFRYTVQQQCMELPQGSWEQADDVAPEELARGELREETGLTAERMMHLGTMFLSYGFVNQKQHIFLATGLTQGPAQPDPEEHDIAVHRVPIGEFERMLLTGAIRDATTLAAWGLYKVWREQQQAQDVPRVAWDPALP